MKKSRVKQKLADGDPVLLTTLHLTDASMFELASLMGFDGIWMDLEHHSYNLETAAQLMRAARVGTSDVMVRPAKGEFMRMGRILEAGAQGIMYPRCDSADEAREVVQWAKFAPQGTRGFDGANADAPYCTLPIPEYIAAANQETFVVVQIESQAAVEQAEEIAAVDGVDVLFLGPADFSILGGFPGEWDHPELQAARTRLAQVTQAAGKVWGSTAASPEAARQLMSLGARFICCGSDIQSVKSGLEKLQQEFHRFGFTFENQFSKGS